MGLTGYFRSVRVARIATLVLGGFRCAWPSGVLGTRSAMCRGKMVRQGTARGWARTDRREWSDRRSRLVGGLLPLPVKVT